MNIQIGKGFIRILRGDITEQETDAIVNAANNHLWMGAGVAGAIKRKGGEEIEREAVAQGPIDVGGAVVTSGGNLKARHVIHAAVMGQDLTPSAESIERATVASLELAERNGWSSVSFPALGTGVGGFSVHHCARIMIGAAIDALLNARHLGEVRFVLFDEPTTEAFKLELQRRFTAHHGR
jgi:O-acetyl-ADP-ribose deacetylase (regulator of RNase III)